MNRPGFRPSNGNNPRGHRTGSGFTGSVGRGAPFSQVQILQLMKSEFARARRHGYSVACVVLEVDRLGALADLHGSELRDEVRGALQRLFGEKLRDGDHVGNLKEHRMLLVLPHTPADGARVVAERLRAGLAALEVTVSGSRMGLTLSAGLAACGDKETLFFETLLAQAETGLEEALAAGGDRVVVFQRASGA